MLYSDIISRIEKYEAVSCNLQNSPYKKVDIIRGYNGPHLHSGWTGSHGEGLLGHCLYFHLEGVEDAVCQQNCKMFIKIGKILHFDGI